MNWVTEGVFRIKCIFVPLLSHSCMLWLLITGIEWYGARVSLKLSSVLNSMLMREITLRPLSKCPQCEHWSLRLVLMFPDVVIVNT